MSRKIIGATVGTNINPKLLEKYVQDGKSAYELAVENGFKGTEQEWLASLNGSDGYTPVKGKDYFDGKDGYTPVKGVDYFDGQPGKDGTDGYTPIKGKDYFDGKDGKDGESGVYVGSGAMPDGYNVQIDPNGSPLTFDDIRGYSAYEIAIRNGFKGTEAEWIESLHGKDGEKGADGYTPVKGTDYFTEADKAEMASAVLSALPVYDGEVVSV